ncbi:mannose-1-phosphate guanylyltransferase/mannose-6-phosphate isomerase [Fodinicurvata fenggangensis]|uniref:mannose-1-phosphate guanylyltransferase/mannose-6-phosphate isomerase n=1 Tax=Fodinicurvata fenggangensis TaxID=1121830 RepID=UPI001FE20464|nr:mannose-1-phosphate guanylyltransferase/mannose-6-phosphate isomerase [Fodinicurvata fenggangensis]
MMTEKAGPFPLQPVILSGGSGTRLWPLSRESHPKQLLPLQHESLSLLQQTAGRVSASELFLPPLLVASHDHRFLVAEQLRSCGIVPDSILLEPMGRNTAPAIAVAALHCHRQDPARILVILPADHRIDDEEEFQRAVQVAATSAAAGSLVTLGITPDHPEPGYGYMKMGPTDETVAGVWHLAGFTEKPSLAVAESYLEAGNYLWNSGLFIARADTLLRELAHYAPEVLEACRLSLEGAERDLDFLRVGEEAFQRAPAISFDYAIMEHTTQGRVVPCDPGWSDLGSWQALWKEGSRDSAGNTIRGRVVADGVRNSLLHSDDSRLLAAVDLEDMLVVTTADSVLVAPFQAGGKIGQLVETIKLQGHPEATEYPLCHRPWGSYETLAEGGGFKVKRIIVKPGGTLSLQYHQHRTEHWVVVSGEASILKADSQHVLQENQSLYIPAGTPHRLSNISDAPLTLIEVQCGAYLGEDDIVRLDDIYGRKVPEAPSRNS